MINLKLYEDLKVDDTRRFYPSCFPVTEYEPLKTYFAILESPEEIKRGIISLATFHADDLIAQCIGTVLKFQNLYTLQHSENIFYYDEFFAGYLLHSCSPNSYLDMSDFSLHAIKKIRPFEIISIDYEKTEDKLYQSFDCHCGSDNCRKFIDGRKK